MGTAFWGSGRQLSKAAAFYIPTSSGRGFQSLHILTNIYFLYIFIIPTLVGMKWYHFAVLICTSLMTLLVRHLYSFFREVCVQVLCPLKLKIFLSLSCDSSWYTVNTRVWSGIRRANTAPALSLRCGVGAEGGGGALRDPHNPSALWALERVSLWNLTELGSSFSIRASWPSPNQLLHRAGGTMPGAHKAALLSFHNQKRKKSNF